MDITTHEIKQSVSGNLDLYADGDASFRSELRGLMIKDLQELRAVVDEISYEGDSSKLRAAVHKVKVTLDILNVRELFRLLEEIGSQLTFSRASVFAEKLRDFHAFYTCIISALQEETYA